MDDVETTSIELVGTKAIAKHIGITERDAWIRIRKRLLPITRRQIGNRMCVVASIRDLIPHRQIIGMDAVARHLDMEVRRAYHLQTQTPLPKSEGQVCVTPSDLQRMWRKYL